MSNILVAATANSDKIREINRITENMGIDIIPRSELVPEDLEIEEDGETFEENSLKKARTIMEYTGKPAIADDSGLEVEFLHGAPGVYSARFAGEESDAQKNNEKLLALMEDLPYKDRRARFVCVITVAYPDGRTLVARGECSGHILFEPEGDGGFGYDPLFVPDGYQRTFAQMKPEEKNKISHRAKALVKLKKLLEDE